MARPSPRGFGEKDEKLKVTRILKAARGRTQSKTLARIGSRMA